MHILPTSILILIVALFSCSNLVAMHDDYFDQFDFDVQEPFLTESENLYAYVGEVIDQLDNAPAIIQEHESLEYNPQISSQPPLEKQEFMCNVCNHKFWKNAHLKIHQRTHTGERPFTCSWPDCNKTFTQGGNLTRHMKTKHNVVLKEHKAISIHCEKPFKCTVKGCNKAYAQKPTLKEHILFHMYGKKPFKCTVPDCDKAYAQKRSLFHHMKKHTEQTEQ